MISRLDAVVILARGEGQRMGGPKQGLRIPGGSKTFLEMIAGIYEPRGWPVTVVVGPGQTAATGALATGVRIVEGPSGGDTALTMMTAWKADALAFTPPTHYWAHPVDLPLVGQDSVARLLEVSERHPRAIVRPGQGGDIGHPVILPREILQALGGEPARHDGPLRKHLDRITGQGGNREMIVVEVPDPGVVRDFDEPGDLEIPWRPTEEGKCGDE